MKEENQLAKWLAGAMEESELADFKKTTKYETYQKIARYSAELVVPDMDAAMYQNIISKKPKPKVMGFTKRYWPIAAVLVIGLGLFFGITTFSETTERALVGKTSTFILPDASEVTLNSESKIDYSKGNWNSKRCLKLDGEAFFKVSKGKKFDVLTSLGKVTVVGTQFNVKVREKRFEVECFEGTVWVENGTQKVVLSKGNIAVFDNGILLSATASGSETPAWMHDEIRIISLPLTAILDELERDYGISIQNKNPNFNQKFSGILPKNNLEKALKIISETYRLHYVIQTKNTVILTPKP